MSQSSTPIHKQHTVMDNADDPNHTIALRAADNNMPWPVDALAWLRPAASKP